MGCWKMVSLHIKYGFTCKYNVLFWNGAKTPDITLSFLLWKLNVLEALIDKEHTVNCL